MNKIYIFFILVVFYTTLSTSFSLPASFKDIKKRAEDDTNGDSGEFTQCVGNFPITYTDNKVTYTPKIWEPGTTVTEHIKGTSTATITNGTIANWNVYTTDKKFLFSFIADYCTLLVDDKPCPIPPGSFDKTVEWKFNEDDNNPNLPKDQTIDYYFNSTIVDPSQTTLSCLEGTVTIKYPDRKSVV